jgi:hypothetical protein
MYDTGKIIPGLIIFVGLITFPIWSQGGKAAPAPEPKLDTPAIQAMVCKKCVEGKEFMRKEHMQLLNQWRDEVVREGKRFESHSLDPKLEKSLQKTCMKCHSNKKEFCDSCHTYASVAPYCWECHIQPKEPKEPKESM